VGTVGPREAKKKEAANRKRERQGRMTERELAEWCALRKKTQKPDDRKAKKQGKTPKMEGVRAETERTREQR